VEDVRRGDIWTVTLPAFPKPRPALVVSIDAINDLRPDVIVVPLTTHAGPLRVSRQTIQRPASKVASFAKCETVGPLHKSQLKTRVGRLPVAAWSSIESGLARVLGIRQR
jgi:mRNA-degrading endonuclease toxin of MazEF toxin-antitoxin module